MIQIGIKQTLKVDKETDFGVYLIADQEESILLPKRHVPEGLKKGDELEVFIYRDSEDRLIATTKEPKIQLGELAVLRVKDLTRIGGFLDWGLEKDLFIPFKEQKGQLKKDKDYLFALYVDKSDRLCATMKLYERLETDHEYVVDDVVSGRVYDMNDKMGAFVAVDDRYHGMIPIQDIHGNLQIGDIVAGRVTKVREDGKITINPRPKVQDAMDQDAQLILDKLAENDGVLYFNDKSDPTVIKTYFKISKRAFKRAVGYLLKAGKITMTDDRIELVHE